MYGCVGRGITPSDRHTCTVTVILPACKVHDCNFVGGFALVINPAAFSSSLVTPLSWSASSVRFLVLLCISRQFKDQFEMAVAATKAQLESDSAITPVPESAQGSFSAPRSKSSSTSSLDQDSRTPTQSKSNMASPTDTKALVADGEVEAVTSMPVQEEGEPQSLQHHVYQLHFYQLHAYLHLANLNEKVLLCVFFFFFFFFFFESPMILKSAIYLINLVLHAVAL